MNCFYRVCQKGGASRIKWRKTGGTVSGFRKLHFALAIDLSFHVPKFVIMSADGEILEDLGTRFENSFIDEWVDTMYQAGAGDDKGGK